MEVTAALTIAVLAGTAGAAALGHILDITGRAQAESDEIGRAAAARRTMIAWLSGAHLIEDYPDAAFRGLDREAAGNSDDEVVFLTTSAAPFNSGTSLVRLAIDRDRSTPERGLVAELVRLGEAEGRRIEIAPHATGLDVRYLLDGENRWLPGWISTVRLPTAIEVTILGHTDSLPALLSYPLLVVVGGAR